MRRLLALAFALVLLQLAACGDDAPPPLEIVTTAALLPQAQAFVEFLPYPSIQLRAADDPAAALAGGDGLHVAVVADLSCKECYRLERTATGFVVHGDAPLGVQYGLAHLLELAGVRFYHPWRTHMPARLRVPDDAPDLGVQFEPEMSVRGLHLHTLHPIEAYWSFWVPSPAHLEGARRVLDWTVKNRGNYIQWVALDDIQEDAATYDAWKPHTRAIIDAAHARGLQVGIGVQLFGVSNLQQAWDLIDQPLSEVDGRTQIEARLPPMVDGLPWDRVNLSFGEFFNADPAEFVQHVDEAYAVLQALAPGTELTALIHVGDSPDQRVTYMGQDMIYYFLVQFANPAVVPQVHTVMYYNLFDDAGGAYHHDEFDAHRDFLLDRLGAGERVVYFPESAYWITFDVSVPTYLPIYVESRARDLREIRDRAPPGLDEHLLFSSGWEWGYWQHDYAVLRMNYQLGDGQAVTAFAQMFASYGDGGAQLAVELAAVADVQYDALLVHRLAPWLAGRDVYYDLADEIGVVSQPTRPTFETIAARTPAERAAFGVAVVDRLERFASDVQDRLEAVRALDLPHADPFIAEILDGLEIDVWRARCIIACLRATLSFADGEGDGGHLAEAEAALAGGRAVVQRRHADLHYATSSSRDEIIGANGNATIYPFGYLKQADELCYWEREIVQIRKLVGVSDAVAPACVF